MSKQIKIGSIVESGDHGTPEYDRGRVLTFVGRGDGRAAHVAWFGARAVYLDDVRDLRLARGGR